MPEAVASRVRTHVVVAGFSNSRLLPSLERSAGPTLPLKRGDATDCFSPSQFATPVSYRYRREVRRDLKGKRRCHLIIHRAGVPVVGGLSRFHPPSWATHCSESGGTSGDGKTMRFADKKRKGAVEKSGPLGAMWRKAVQSRREALPFRHLRFPLTPGPL